MTRSQALLIHCDMLCIFTIEDVKFQLEVSKNNDVNASPFKFMEASGFIHRPLGEDTGR